MYSESFRQNRGEHCAEDRRSAICERGGMNLRFRHLTADSTSIQNKPGQEHTYSLLTISLLQPPPALFVGLEHE